jgi:hypothetical protein
VATSPEAPTANDSAAIDYRADRIVLAADSAIYDETGVVHGIGSKVYTLPTIRAGKGF